MQTDTQLEVVIHSHAKSDQARRVANSTLLKTMVVFCVRTDRKGGATSEAASATGFGVGRPEYGRIL
eukprot:1196393-Prorocentrum_minimum.AAC.6